MSQWIVCATSEETEMVVTAAYGFVIWGHRDFEDPCLFETEAEAQSVANRQIAANEPGAGPIELSNIRVERSATVH